MNVFIIIFVVSSILIFVFRFIARCTAPTTPFQYMMWRISPKIDLCTVMILCYRLSTLVSLISGGVILTKLLIKLLG